LHNIQTMMPNSDCAGCTAAKSKGRNAKYCDRHRKEAKKIRDKKSNEKRSHSIILKHSKIITTGTRSLEDLIDLHGEWGRTPFTQNFGYWEKVGELDRSRSVTHMTMPNTRTRDPEDQLCLSMYNMQQFLSYSRYLV
jgi:hypothetical protein